MIKVEHLISSIDLKGQCGPLDLRFLKNIFWRDRRRQKELSHYSFLFSLELKRRAEERAKEGQEEDEGLRLDLHQQIEED